MLRLSGLATRIDGRVLVRGIDLELRRGEVLGLVGASGAGKSVLLKTVIGLLPPAAGTIEIFGRNVALLNEQEREQLGTRWGVLFQDGALFSSLTVGENIAVPLRERFELPPELMHELIVVKLGLVGLQPETAALYPAQLSGGMTKRAALARALALDPPLLFLDEPTSGLDPIGASEFDALVRDLQKSLDLTVFMVTHDIDSLVAIADRIAVLIDNRLKIGTMDDMLRDTDPWIHAYFHGPRGRAATGHVSNPGE